MSASLDRLRRGSTLGAVLFVMASGTLDAGCRDKSRDGGTGAAADAGSSAGAADAQSARIRRTRTRPIVVTIVVDQLAAWIAEERFPKLAPDGGFARLRSEGTWLTRLRYSHAVTDTAPGHAALYSGAVPRESGIFGNELVTAEREIVSVLRDDRTRSVYPQAIDPAISSSPARLKVEVVADRLRAAHPDAWIVSLSLKDRGAILPGGHKPTSVVWLDVGQARFITSTAYANALPEWVGRRGEQSAVLAALAPWLAETEGGEPGLIDDQAGEGDESGFGTTFPHRVDAIHSPGRAFRTMPASDEVLLDMALDALDSREDLAHRDAGGRDDQAVLLELSLSANDYVGHVFGPDSWEAWAELRRLDRSLSKFFRSLDERFGATGWDVVLSADHGVVSMPEIDGVAGAHPWCRTVIQRADAGASGASGAPADPWGRPCGKAYRVDLDALSNQLIAAAEAALPGKRDLVRGVADPYVFVGDGARTLASADRAKLDTALRRVMEATPGIRRVFEVDALPDVCPDPSLDEGLREDARIAALVCRSAMPRTGETAGGYYLVTTPGSFLDPRVVRNHGSSHGSPYLYDRTVPLLIRAPDRVARGARVDDVTDFRAFAATVSGLLSIDPPAAASKGTDVSKAIAR